MKRTFLSLYMAITSLVVLRALFNGQDLISYFDFTSLSLVLVPCTLVFLLTKKQKNCFKHVILTSILAGFFGLVLGVILTFSNGHLDVEGAFMGLSVALLPMFYALLVSLLIFPFHLVSNDK
ncbi:MotA/TolQ/ExbB proton channel family protein [Vibrio vulnificus]|nr:MotA/TolQ/ExbB proton channel family protein [Vibrio vulnificus]